MANDKLAVLVLLLAFLFLLTAPLVLIIGYYFGILPPFLIDLFAKKVMLSHIITAATAGLFLIPVIFVFLAAIIVAVKKRRLATPSVAVAKAAVARQAPARYHWEGMFGQGKRREEKSKQTSKPHTANLKAAAAVVIVIAIVILVLLLPKATKPDSIADANKTAAANDAIPAETPSDVTAEKQNVLSRILAKVFAARNATNETQEGRDAVEKPAGEVKPQRNISSVSLSAAAKNTLGSVKDFGGKVKGKFVDSASKAKSAVAKVPDAAWQKIAVAAVALLVAGVLFYSHRAGQLGEIPAWFLGWLDWLKHIFAAAWKNKARVILVAAVIFVAAAGMAAFVFRKKLNAKLPDLSLSAVSDKALDALFAVRDFVLAYRLYILIGIFALLAIIGILFVYETMGRKGKNV